MEKLFNKIYILIRVSIGKRVKHVLYFDHVFLVNNNIIMCIVWERSRLCLISLDLSEQFRLSVCVGGGASRRRDKTDARRCKHLLWGLLARLCLNGDNVSVSRILKWMLFSHYYDFFRWNDWAAILPRNYAQTDVSFSDVMLNHKQQRIRTINWIPIRRKMAAFLLH